MLQYLDKSYCTSMKFWGVGGEEDGTKKKSKESCSLQKDTIYWIELVAVRAG